MTRKLVIGVLFGGRSTEHQVSLVSAQSVIQALDSSKYEIVPIGITPEGRWLKGDQALHLLLQGKAVEEEATSFLPADPTIRALVSMHSKTPVKTLDVIFPVLHGAFGEDGTVQGLFELADLPFVGAGVAGSALAMDKILQKLVCLAAGLPTVEFVWFRGIHWKSPQPVAKEHLIKHQLAAASQEKMIRQIEEQLGYPLFVKPPNLGSSVGITKAHHREELMAGIETALRFDRKVLIEAAVAHAREIEVAILGNEQPRASIPGEVIPSNEFYDYDAKYVDNSSEIRIPADLPQDILQAIQAAAVKSVTALEVEGMSRVDFLVNGATHEYYLNEVNTIPGFTAISMYPKMWEASGLPYPALLDELIRLALERHEQRRQLVTAFTPSVDWYR